MSSRDETLIPVEGVTRRFRSLRASRVLGEPLRWYRSVGSTNEVAGFVAAAGGPEGTVVVADVQGEGRGRGGSRWESPRGGLWFTVLLRPDLPADEVANLMPAAGEAVAKVLREKLGLAPTVKHPNDVLLDGRKVCGILAEASSPAGAPRPDHVLLGVGLNVENELPPELAARATCLADHLAGERIPDRVELLAWLLWSLEGSLGIEAPTPEASGQGDDGPPLGTGA